MPDTIANTAPLVPALTPGPSHYALLLLMGVLWGLALSVAKIGVLAGGHPIGMGLWQVATSSTLRRGGRGKAIKAWAISNNPAVPVALSTAPLKI